MLNGNHAVACRVFALLLQNDFSHEASLHFCSESLSCVERPEKHFTKSMFSHSRGCACSCLLQEHGYIL